MIAPFLSFRSAPKFSVDVLSAAGSLCGHVPCCWRER